MEELEMHWTAKSHTNSHSILDKYALYREVAFDSQSKPYPSTHMYRFFNRWKSINGVSFRDVHSFSLNTLTRSVNFFHQSHWKLRGVHWIQRVTILPLEEECIQKLIPRIRDTRQAPVATVLPVKWGWSDLGPQIIQGWVTISSLWRYICHIQ